MRTVQSEFTLAFQFTPLREGRHDLVDERALAHVQFQFTPLREGRLVGSQIAALAVLFQFTPLREGRLSAEDFQKSAAKFQFTPLREGRRRHSAGRERQCRNFNSRPSARGDKTQLKAAQKENISIHAPPRGATPPRNSTSFPRKISIHAPPRGATTWTAAGTLRRLFQFTPLREGRRKGMGKKKSI